MPRIQPGYDVVSFFHGVTKPIIAASIGEPRLKAIQLWQSLIGAFFVVLAAAVLLRFMVSSFEGGVAEAQNNRAEPAAFQAGNFIGERIHLGYFQKS